LLFETCTVVFVEEQTAMSRRVFIASAVVIVLLVSAAGLLAYAALGALPHGGNSSGPAPSPSGSAVGHTGGGCGVKKNSNGTYTFSWLHVSSDGKIVDGSGCIVNLVGVNMGALFLGDAGVGMGGPQGVPQEIAWFKQHFPMNLVRVNFNSLWWDQNVFVPRANMHFQQWLQQYVKWQEQAGNYVQLDEGPHFPEPPCGGSVTLCPSQDQGKRDYQANPNQTTAQELESNIDPGVRAWADIARIYANDPAVIYDAWNEPTINNLGAFFQDMNTLINTIRAANPRALVVVYRHGLSKIMAGRFPDYQQPNLVIDAHIYDGFRGASPATGKPCSEPGQPEWTPANSGISGEVAFAQQHGHAYIINEWGGCYDMPGYHQQIISFAKADHIALAYFTAGNLVTTTSGGGAASWQLNDNGRLVQSGYAGLL
jgi:hypothetical protein